MTTITTPVPKSPLAELLTGPSGKPVIYITREWYRYLTSLTAAVGGNTNIIVDIITQDDPQQVTDTGPTDTLAASADSYGSQNAGNIEELLTQIRSLDWQVQPPRDISALKESIADSIPFPSPPQELGSLLAAKNSNYRIVSAGSAVLVAGTVTVNNVNADLTNEFSLTTKVVGGTQGILRVGAVVTGTSFVINSSNAADTSTVSWIIFGRIKG